MSVFSPDVNIDSPLPLPIDGGNPNPVLVTGTVTANLGTLNGAATAANQATQITDLATIIADLTNGTQHTLIDNFPATQPISGSVTVLNASIPVTGTFWQATQPVSGTLTVNQGTSPWVVSGTVTTSPNVNVHDGAGNTIASTGTSLNVDVTNTIPVTGTFWQAVQPVSGTVAVSNFPATVAVTQSTSPWVVSGTVAVTGVATAANQATEIADLASLIANQTNGTQESQALGAVTTAPPVYVTGTNRMLSLDTAGNLRVYVENPAGTLTSSSDTVTQITSTGANQVLLAANINRKKAILFFESGIWNVKFGAGASATSKTYMVASSNTTIEVPVWLGEIDALCTTSGKLVDVTEMI